MALVLLRLGLHVSIVTADQASIIADTSPYEADPDVDYLYTVSRRLV